MWENGHLNFPAYINLEVGGWGGGDLGGSFFVVCLPPSDRKEQDIENVSVCVQKYGIYLKFRALFTTIEDNTSGKAYKTEGT